MEKLKLYFDEEIKEFEPKRVSYKLMNKVLPFYQKIAKMETDGADKIVKSIEEAGIEMLDDRTAKNPIDNIKIMSLMADYNNKLDNNNKLENYVKIIQNCISTDAESYKLIKTEYTSEFWQDQSPEELVKFITNFRKQLA